MLLPGFWNKSLKRLVVSAAVPLRRIGTWWLKQYLHAKTLCTIPFWDFVQTGIGSSSNVHVFMGDLNFWLSLQMHKTWSCTKLRSCDKPVWLPRSAFDVRMRTLYGYDLHILGNKSDVTCWRPAFKFTPSFSFVQDLVVTKAAKSEVLPPGLWFSLPPWGSDVLYWRSAVYNNIQLCIADWK